ncbi:MAG: hypothetical protein ABIU05_05935, partial [Nitrospirales bacterium]
MTHLTFIHPSRATRFISLATMLGVLAMGTISPEPAISMPTIQAQLTTLPQVPTPITRKEAAHVVVNVEAKEYV